MPSFSKRSILRYIVRSGVPVSLDLPATESPNKTSGLSSSYACCSGHSKSGSKSSQSSVCSTFRRLLRPMLPPLTASSWDGQHATLPRSRLGQPDGRKPFTSSRELLADLAAPPCHRVYVLVCLRGVEASMTDVACPVPGSEARADTPPGMSTRSAGE